MKKNILLILAVLLGTLLCPAAGSFSLTMTGQAQFSADNRFSELYSSTSFMPQLELGYDLGPALGLHASIALLSREGRIAELDETITLSQARLGLGLGYRLLQSGPFRLGLQAGLVLIRFSEEAMDLENSNSVWGGRLGLYADHALSGSLFLHLETGYTLATRSEEELEMKLSGLTLGGGLRISF